MNTHEFLSYLKSLDIRLSLNGERLTCNAPKDALTPSLRSELAERKAEIIALLQDSNLAGNSTSLPIQSVPRNQDLPLSYSQQRLWFLDQLEPNSPFYNIPVAVRLQGDLNLQILKPALDALVVHHEILRTNYISQDGNPIQIINVPQAVELLIIDLQQYEPAEQETQLQKLLQQESQRPFNLASDLMIRGCLLQLAPHEHMLLLVMHHIASDGWSIGILWEQLTQLYQAFLTGQSNPLPTLPIQYADYAVWQREWLAGEVLDQQLKYWKQQLVGANPVLELPTDRPRTAVQTYRGASQSVVIPETLTKSLKQLCSQQWVTLYMTLLAAFQTLLYRYSTQEDIIVGSPIAGRNCAEIQELIGFFVNTLVLRTDMSGNPSFQELLGKVRSVTLDAYAHQDLPFEKLVEELQPERSLSYNPLFQVMFVLRNAPRQAGQLLGLTETPVQLEAETAQFDLTLSVAERDGVLVGSWEYNTDLFDAATIERMTAHFQTLLKGIVANPEQSISELPLLTAKEKQQLLMEWNDTTDEYPQDKCIHQLFEEQVEQTPEAIAIEYAGEKLTYGELNTRANQLAHYLRSLGVEADKFVGIFVERSLEMVVGLLGILKAGAAYIPLDPAYPAERLSYMVADAAISVLLTQNKWTSQLPEHQAQVICLDSDWDKIALDSQENPTQTNTGENLAYVIYTSGSTGKPKGVMISHQALTNFTQIVIVEYQLTASDRLLQFASLNFDVAVEEIYPCLCVGGTLVLRTDQMLIDLRTFFQACQDWQLTVLNLPTAYWHQLAVELANTNVALPESLRLAIIGGERVLPEPVRIWQEYVVKSGKSDYLELINAYGPTETTVSATLYRIPFRTSSLNCEVPIGRPLAHLQTYILDSHLQPVPIGVPGELHIGGDSLTRGYLNRPELTAEKFIPNPFSQEPRARLYKTGDLVRYRPDGNIEFLGRIDHQVKIRGFRIELGEIEAVLSQHPSVEQTIVIDREDNPGDKRLVAYLVPNDPSVNPNQLRDFLKQKLPDYMIPSAFVLLETLPLTPNGKIDRRALPAPDQARLESEGTFVAPRDELELQLTKIWEKVLGIKAIGIHDNFFDLEGHSLLAVRLFAEIEKTFQKNLPLAALFQSPTVAELAKILSQEEWSSSWYSFVPIQPIGDRIPLFAIHLLGEGLSFYRPLASYLGQRQPIYGLNYGLAARKRNEEEVSLPPTKDLAAHYIKEMQAFQPQGPYVLLGVSNGGNVAFEMAKQLHAQGQTVAKLILFDTIHPNLKLPQNWKNMSSFQKLILDLIRNIDIHWGNLLLFEHKERLPYLLDKVKILSTKWLPRLPKTLSLSIRSFVSNVTKKQQEINSPSVSPQYYIPQAYPGKITLFKGKHTKETSSDPTNGWEGIAEEGLEIYNIHGAHSKILSEPSIRILSRKLKECLESVSDLNQPNAPFN